MAKFTILFNNDLIKAYELKDPIVTIGRLPENTISIANMGISRRHVRIECDSAHNYTLTDLNSLNGTFINSNRVKKSTLSNNDKISIGKYTIIFEQEDGAPADIQPEPSIVPPENVVNTKDVIQSDTDMKIKVDPSPPTVEQPAPSISEDSGSAVLIETNKHLIYKLDKKLTTLGTNESDDIFLSGTFLGKVLITIEREGDETWIQSKNLFAKLKINGKSAKLHQLQHKDKIEIGKNTFRYMENG